MRLLSVMPAARRYAPDAAIILSGSVALLLCCAHLPVPRMPLGLLSLLLLALAARAYPLAGGDPRDVWGVLPLVSRHVLPLASSTPLLATIALYGPAWATVVATSAAACDGVLVGLRGQRGPYLLTLWRAVAGDAVAAALAGLLYTAIDNGAPLSSPVPALPALFVAEGAVVCGAWGLIALRMIARREALDARARRGVLEALPALASEPALAFVLAGAVATGQPLAVLAAALPVAALVGGLRWHTTMRRQLEQAHMDLSRAHTRLEAQAATDPLTGLANRGLFERALAARLAESARHGRPVAVLLVDLDAFKGINDSYGHACGDKVLVAVAGALRRGLRGSDLPARLGGDEFVALLPETDTARALALARRVCAEIAALEIAVGTATIYPTASIGAASTTHCAHADADALLAAADSAAYAAKRAGKNMACLAA